MASGRKTQHSMQGAFIFVLLGLFALMSTLMVLLGAQMYRATVDNSERNNQGRVLSAYVRSMARAYDTADSVSVQKLGDITALAFTEVDEGETYVTWIYQYEGRLYEQFTDLVEDFSPARGTEICEANSFEPSVENCLLNVKMTDGADQPCEVKLALRCA